MGKKALLRSFGIAKHARAMTRPPAPCGLTGMRRAPVQIKGPRIAIWSPCGWVAPDLCTQLPRVNHRSRPEMCTHTPPGNHHSQLPSRSCEHASPARWPAGEMAGRRCRRRPQQEQALSLDPLRSLLLSLGPARNVVDPKSRLEKGLSPWKSPEFVSLGDEGQGSAALAGSSNGHLGVEITCRSAHGEHRWRNVPSCSDL